MIFLELSCQRVVVVVAMTTGYPALFSFVNMKCELLMLRV